MPYVAVYDANVLYQMALRDLLIGLGQQRNLQLRVRWTEEILEEVFRSLSQNRPDLEEHSLARLRQWMRDPVPDCLVTGYEPLVDALDLPDPSDRHVLAAAIRCNAQAIVTFNTRHFPEGVLSRFDIEAQHPDTFVADLVELNPATVVHVLHENIGRLANPPISLGDRLARLGSTGLPRTADLLEEELGFGG